MTDELYMLREACEGDMATLNAFAALEGMDNIPSLEGVTVAQSAQGDIVGFIRIVLDDAGVAHINPVVVYDTWRGYGVGRALVEHAQKHYGELRLVSRGSSRAFYEALGFTPLSWQAIKPSIAAECDGCEMRSECNPTPMTRVCLPSHINAGTGG